MRVVATLVLAAWLFVFAAGTSLAREICTLVVEAETGAVVHESGECDTRVTPASTFKIALALIGFDSGVLVDPKTPALAFQSGDPDWGARWREDTDPAHWMKYSVLWYSQRITNALGAETMSDYLDAFDYGNRDFSGDAGFNNALERAWVSSSLTISPREQTGLLSRMLGRSLPVSRAAFENTLAIIDAYSAVDGWAVRGKTGGAYPRNADRSFNYAAGWGWFIGWAERDGRTLIFATLSQDETRVSGSPGIRARDAFLARWPALVANF